MSDSVILEAVVKASMFKEALASCQLEGIGEKLTLMDLYYFDAFNEMPRGKEKYLDDMKEIMNLVSATKFGLNE